MTTCKKTLDKAAPVKQKYVWSNQSPFLNKQILKAIMNRTRLRNNLAFSNGAQMLTVDFYRSLSSINSLSNCIPLT